MTETDVIIIYAMWCGVMVLMGIIGGVAEIVAKIINHRKEKAKRLKKIDGTKGYRIVTR